MKISKLLPTLCALAVGANCLTAQAEDTPDQAAARNALAQKLFELSAQPPPATNAVAEKPAVAPEPTAVTTSQPATPPAAVAPENSVPKVESAPKTLDDDVVMTPVNNKAAKAKAKADKAAAAVKAKQEAAQAAADLKAKKEADKKLAAQRAAEAKAAKAQAKAQAKANQAAAAASVKAEADQKAAAQKAAVNAAMADKQAAEAQAKANPPAAETKPVPPPAVVPPPAQTGDVNYAGKDIGMKPIEAPALPISASKEEQLQALLAKYKADQITPEEYHNQRAAILAQP
jgi:hypothetical protein